MKEQFIYFTENVWPDVAEEYDLTADDEPPMRAFVDWWSGSIDNAVDMMGDR